ncbi:Dos2-interacting transcription regulator of RNA-Pol-II-domain-containing protein [Radiomyces spectabilis]|uniref:Dos2-interacting transcription regulator of RNA-Pol-II-domain-containing protein n=1 Tax=Radiomyces spectabilis TaxID=64574 RepID=UPI0022203596|nr:Dos2-interacting transcription regulator of RNA-Pol-II-domain-containing protein [Radiomyces spectabilis]KAI8370563.1 Dos2-interacting transcription regulator of RNA-Pol-II-domain-containing protein [Radiomyces spectabilis]
MTSRCRQLISDWLVSSRDEVDPSLLAHILLDLTKSIITISNVLDIVGAWWDEAEGVYRAKCIDLSTQVISHSRNNLDNVAVQALVEFVSTHLADPAMVAPWFDMLSVVTATPCFKSHHATLICQSIFSEIDSKKLIQSTRHKIFLFFGECIEHHLPALQGPDLNFIPGFVNFMDGEKDPRNLLVAFELIRVIIDKFDISRHVEDLFEIVFCYFPIQFTPPPNDPYGITTDDLKESLRRCLAATPYFANFATPLLIEKLVTWAGSAKKDVMDTIALCASTYGAHALLPHAYNMFNALVKEVYYASDVAMEKAALDTIHSVVATLATGISIANIRDPVEKAIDALLNECIEELKEPELKKAKSAAYILRAAASASDPACTSVAHAAIPLLYQQFKITDPASRQKAILDIFIEILEASKSQYGSVDDVKSQRDLQTPLLMYKQQILQVFVLSLIGKQATDRQLRYSSLQGIRLMAMDITVNHLTRLLTIDDPPLRELALSTLVVLSKRNPTSIARYTFPDLISQLPDGDHPVFDHYADALSSIEHLARLPSLFTAIVQPLVTKFDWAVQEHTDTKVMAYACALANCISRLLSVVITDAEVLQLGQTMLLPYILTNCVKASLSPPTCSWYLPDSVVNILASILAIIVRKSNASMQNSIMADTFNLFVRGDTSVLGLPPTPTFANKLYDPIMEDSIPDITILFTAIIGNSRRDVQYLPAGEVAEFLDNIVHTSLRIPCLIKVQSLAMATACIVNKYIRDDIVPSIRRLFLELINNFNTTVKSQRQGSFLMTTWLVKGLLVRGHSLGFELLDSIVNQCQSPHFGKEAAQSFAVILRQDDFLLNKASHATLSILYRQRVFNHCLSPLLQGAASENHEIQFSCLVALTDILSSVPSQIAANDVTRLMPSIIASLELHDTHMNLIMIAVIQNIVPAAAGPAAQLVEPVIRALISLTRDRPTAVRIAAVQCLTHFVKACPAETVKPFAGMVVRALAAVLDDKKRLVRRAAVDCREQWFAMESR